MENKITIKALFGEAGSGKDYLLQQYLQTGDYHEIISCTTRPPRDYEINGKNYYFLSEEEFKHQMIEGEMLETTLFNTWYYGTSLKSLSTTKTNIGVFNPEGIRSLLKVPYIEVQPIRVCADADLRLLRQLSREDAPDPKEIIRRYYADQKDFSNIDFDYVIYDNNVPLVNSY